MYPATSRYEYGSSSFCATSSDCKQTGECLAQSLHERVDAGVLFGCLGIASGIRVGRRRGHLDDGLDADGDERVHAVGHVAGVVELADAIGEATSEVGAHRVAGVGDLVADGVEDDAGVVAVLADHGVDVGLPPLGEDAGVVVAHLRVVPHVERFVHHEHPDPVARVEERLARRVVGAADGVEPRRLEDLDPALVGAFHRRRADHAVVVMDARAAEVHRPRR